MGSQIKTPATVKEDLNAIEQNAAEKTSQNNAETS